MAVSPPASWILAGGVFRLILTAMLGDRKNVSLQATGGYVDNDGRP